MCCVLDGLQFACSLHALGGVMRMWFSLFGWFGGFLVADWSYYLLVFVFLLFILFVITLDLIVWVWCCVVWCGFMFSVVCFWWIVIA